MVLRPAMGEEVRKDKEKERAMAEAVEPAAPLVQDQNPKEYLPHLLHMRTQGHPPQAAVVPVSCAFDVGRRDT